MERRYTSLGELSERGLINWFNVLCKGRGKEGAGARGPERDKEEGARIEEVAALVVMAVQEVE